MFFIITDIRVPNHEGKNLVFWIIRRRHNPCPTLIFVTTLKLYFGTTKMKVYSRLFFWRFFTRFHAASTFKCHVLTTI